MLGVYKLVVRYGPQVFYVVDEEQIGRVMMREENDLRAS